MGVVYYNIGLYRGYTNFVEYIGYACVEPMGGSMGDNIVCMCNTLYVTIRYTYNVLCTLYVVQCTSYTICSTVYNVRRTAYSGDIGRVGGGDAIKVLPVK